MSREAINVEWLSSYRFNSGHIYSWSCPLCGTKNEKTHKEKRRKASSPAPTHFTECQKCKTTVKIKYPPPFKTKPKMFDEF
jgi:transposase-like protein